VTTPTNAFEQMILERIEALEGRLGDAIDRQITEDAYTNMRMWKERAEKAERERDEFRAELVDLHKRNNENCAAKDAARADVERLREALRRYSTHDSDCKIGAGCTCGLQAALDGAS
jgi:predicted Ser/Thr protein kinase